jgi:hypothetical protein
VSDSHATWFAEARAETDGEARFLARLRELAPTLADAGLSAHKSVGESWASGPLVGVELDHLTSPLRWLWVVYRDAGEGGLINCGWGDDTRFDDWGPIDGNVNETAPKAKSTSRPHATPEHAAEAAVAWIRTQASRRVRRDDWAGRRPRTRWTFTDTGGVLWDTRTSPIRRDHAPDTTRAEQASADHTHGAGGASPE